MNIFIQPQQKTEQTGYIISTEDFKKICDSKYIAVRLHENEGGYIAEYLEDKCEKLLSFFRVFYREAINNNCYKEESVSQLTDRAIQNWVNNCVNNWVNNCVTFSNICF